MFDTGVVYLLYMVQISDYTMVSTVKAVYLRKPQEQEIYSSNFHKLKENHF